MYYLGMHSAIFSHVSSPVTDNSYPSSIAQLPSANEMCNHFNVRVSWYGCARVDNTEIAALVERQQSNLGLSTLAAACAEGTAQHTTPACISPPTSENKIEQTPA